MIAIAAVDENFGIGYKGDLLVRIPEDMKRFRKLTAGNVVVYGRNTLAGFPNGKPLKGRVNIILSGDPNFYHKLSRIPHFYRWREECCFYYKCILFGKNTI